MKDSNDAQTIDWVDEVEVVSKEVATPDLGFHITENAALDKALNRIVTSHCKTYLLNITRSNNHEPSSRNKLSRPRVPSIR
jgi:hypothetical protein